MHRCRWSVVLAKRLIRTVTQPSVKLPPTLLASLYRSTAYSWPTQSLPSTRTIINDSRGNCSHLSPSTHIMSALLFCLLNHDTCIVFTFSFSSSSSTTFRSFSVPGKISPYMSPVIWQSPPQLKWIYIHCTQHKRRRFLATAHALSFDRRPVRCKAGHLCITTGVL